MEMEPVQLFSWWAPSRCLTPMLRRYVWVPLVALAVMLSLNVWWLVNRTDPLVVLDPGPIPAGRPGETVRFDAKVVRDFTPPCAIFSQRIVVSSGGYRFNIDHTEIDGMTIYELTKDAPDRLRTTLTIPQGILPGRARLITSLEYHCNPIDVLFPNVTTTTLYFDVLPPL
jgi:hypothetical protein